MADPGRERRRLPESAPAVRPGGRSRLADRLLRTAGRTGACDGA